MVIAARKGGFGVTDLQKLLREAKVAVVPVGEEAATEAFDAWLRFGKRNHPPRLNFGDCFAYALARLPGAPRFVEAGLRNNFRRMQMPEAIEEY